MKKSAPTKSKPTAVAVKLPSPVIPIENNALTVTTDSKVDIWFAAVEMIVKKADEINTQYQDLLYQRLNEMYKVYYHWMTVTEGKEDFFEQIDGLLDKRGIGYNAGTDEALKLTKTYIGQTSSTASKHATHMRVAFNRGVQPKDYAAWTVENGIEAISRQASKKPAIEAPRMSPEEKDLYSRACLLIQQWLMEKEQQPVASAVADEPTRKIKASSLSILYGYCREQLRTKCCSPKYWRSDLQKKKTQWSQWKKSSQAEIVPT